METENAWFRTSVRAISGEDLDRIFPISGYTIGYIRDLRHGRDIDIGVGAQFTLNDMPNRLERYYGTDLPYSFQIFLRIRPSRMEIPMVAK